MCYRCQACTKVVAPKQKLRRHTIHRVRSDGHMEVASEHSVCENCEGLLKSGLSLEKLQRINIKAIEEKASIEIETVVEDYAPIAKPVKLLGRVVRAG